MTLTADDNFFGLDSTQGGITIVLNPYSNGQEAWKCNGKTSVSARYITFTFPGSAGATGRIDRTDYQATFNPQTQTLQGTITLYFFSISDNPYQ